MNSEKSRKTNISVGFTTVITLVVFIITALTAAYIGGVMSGRHLFIKEKPREVEAAPASETTSQEGILKPGELDFAHVLRGETRPPKPSAAPPPEQGPDKAVQDKPVEDKPAPEANTPEAPRPSQVPADPGVIYDFVFQMAALKDAQAVDNLREQLEGAGLRTRMERSGKLYLVLVNMRGTSERVAELAAIARKLRLGEPLLRSRKALSPQGQ